MSVVHLPAERRFIIRLPGGGGELAYDLPVPGVLDLHHTEVTPALRGRGVAGRLVEEACHHARATGARLIPSCPYVAWWFRRHPEEQELLTAEARASLAPGPRAH